MRERLKKLLGRAANAVANLGLSHQGLRVEEIASVDAGTQLLLAHRYREMLHGGAPLPGVDQVGFRAFSQTDEDGILLYLFALLGSGGKRAVEIGAGDGIECNSANLVIHHGWSALLLDGDATRIERGRRFYGRRAETWICPPRLVRAWVQPENVERLLLENGCEGDLDLLSIDVDGIDYWLWKAIEAVRPRVVVIEYNNMWEADQSVTIAYSGDFSRAERAGDYYGASLAALVKLGREKGYRLVGCNRFGFNAFFVRDGAAEDALPAVSVDSCLQAPFAAQRRKARPAAPGGDWIEV